MWSTIGHDAVVTALDRSVELGRVAHAYLFVGPDGVGKRRLAMDLATKVNCAEADERCADRISRGTHPDVVTIGVEGQAGGPTARNISKEQVEDLQRAASLKPYEGPYRVFIIDGGEYLSATAANRLLKTIEEPPSSVIVALLAADEKAILPTIVSRCQIYRMHPVDQIVVCDTLRARFDLDEERARLVASFADGAIGWAIAAARDPDLVDERAARVDVVLSMASMPIDERLVLSGTLAEDYARRRNELLPWLNLFSQCWRDVLLVKGGRETAIINTDRIDILSELASQCSLREISEILHKGQVAMGQLARNANARLVLDVLMFSIPMLPRKATVVG